MDGYVISEEEIEAMFHQLKIHKPEKATRENAIKFLEIWHGASKKLAIKDPKFAEELKKALLEFDGEGEPDS